MDAPCKIQGNIHVLLRLIHKINVSRILGTYHYLPWALSLLRMFFHYILCILILFNTNIQCFQCNL